MSITKKQIIAKFSVAEAQAALKEALARAAAEVKKENAKFRKLPKRQQVVLIAEDVLRQLAVKRLVPEFGTYLSVDRDVEDAIDGGPERDLREILHEEKCHVCGIGSLFVAALDRANGCTADDISSTDNDSFMREYLERWFDESQLNMIEVAFEGRIIKSSYDDADDDTDRALAFAKKTKTPMARLKAIMTNVVKNDGRFIPYG